MVHLEGEASPTRERTGPAPASYVCTTRTSTLIGKLLGPLQPAPVPIVAPHAHATGAGSKGSVNAGLSPR